MLGNGVGRVMWMRFETLGNEVRHGVGGRRLFGWWWGVWFRFRLGWWHCREVAQSFEEGVFFMLGIASKFWGRMGLQNFFLPRNSGDVWVSKI